MKSFQLLGAPASLQSTENVRTARAQAPEVKSDSRYVRFVIAKHSPERVSATGLRIEAREKNRCNGSDAAERSFSLVRFVEEIPRKVGLFRLFQEKRSRVSLQWRLRGGGRSQVRTVLLGKFPKTGENTGNFADLCRL